eukprot:scaffold64192_cov67-Phaeocystis_antarctica.AAC.3
MGLRMSVRLRVRVRLRVKGEAEGGGEGEGEGGEVAVHRLREDRHRDGDPSHAQGASRAADVGRAARLVVAQPEGVAVHLVYPAHLDGLGLCKVDEAAAQPHLVRVRARARVRVRVRARVRVRVRVRVRRSLTSAPTFVQSGSVSAGLRPSHPSMMLQPWYECSPRHSAHSRSHSTSDTART